jgi:multidrug resistance efflux pump
VPRLPQPTLVTEVLVGQNQLVKKGDPLIRFDRRSYEYQVQQMQALPAKAKQNVKVLSADVLVAEQKVSKAKAQLDFDFYGEKLVAAQAKYDSQIGGVNTSVVEAETKL